MGTGESNKASGGLSLTEDDLELLPKQLRDALTTAGFDLAKRGVPASKERKALWCALLAAGVSVADTAALVGISRSTMYRQRYKDPAFAADWDAALEMSIDPIEQRLKDISLTGPVDSMATVRAAEILLKGRSSRYAQGGPARGLKVESKTGGDGTKEFSVTLLDRGGFPD
ncbi:MAG: hypothetical protein RLZZ200_1646 [Pseudomonadota bacterium]|jgi:hypothetical protein